MADLQKARKRTSAEIKRQHKIKLNDSFWPLFDRIGFQSYIVMTARTRLTTAKNRQSLLVSSWYLFQTSIFQLTWYNSLTIDSWSASQNDQKIIRQRDSPDLYRLLRRARTYGRAVHVTCAGWGFDPVVHQFGHGAVQGCFHRNRHAAL